MIVRGPTIFLLIVCIGSGLLFITVLRLKRHEQDLVDVIKQDVFSRVSALVMTRDALSHRSVVYNVKEENKHTLPLVNNVTEENKHTLPLVNNVTEENKHTLPLCPIQSSYIRRRVVDLSNISLERLEMENGKFFRKAHSRPLVCERKEKTAIIIPFRNRHHHLTILLHNLVPMLIRQLRAFTIFVIELAPELTFNRALLLNAGYIEALKHDAFDCFIFHDVDKVPETDDVPYECLCNRSYHISSFLSSFNYTYQAHFAGGVLSFPGHLFRAINGFSNLFFGWGFEDNDMYKRLKILNGRPLEPSVWAGRFQSLGHGRDPGNEKNPIGLMLLAKPWLRARYEGLSSLRYTVEKSEIHQLFIWKTISYDKEYYYRQISEIVGLNILKLYSHSGTNGTNATAITSKP